MFIPDQEEGENGGTLSLHISWSVKTVALTASTHYLHDWHIQLVSAIPKATDCLKKKIKDERKRGSQRQNKFLYTAITLWPMQVIRGAGVQTPATGLSEQPRCDSSSRLVQHPGKIWHWAKRVPRYSLNSSRSCNFRL